MAMTSQQRLTHITQPERVTPGPGYSHVVTGGQLVAVSGQVAIGGERSSGCPRTGFKNVRK
jgi:enamine deaminase RidA (YjgF/YER057c/UK114 family)